MSDIVKPLYSSIIPSAAGVLASHPMLTIKINKQVVGGKPASLYSGVGWYLIKAVPGNSLAFLILQHPRVAALDPWAQGAVSRLTAEAIVYPMGLWATNQQVGRKPNGYFRGLHYSLGRDLIFSTVFLQIHRGWLGDSDMPLPIRLAAAATGASLATQPFDWLKVRGQLGMPMQGLMSGWGWRLAYCNVRSVVAWGLYETLRGTF